jgi:hypothetical protein
LTRHAATPATGTVPSSERHVALGRTGSAFRLPEGSSAASSIRGVGYCERPACRVACLCDRVLMRVTRLELSLRAVAPWLEV